MKSVIKLLFVGLLVTFALARPYQVIAQSGQYYSCSVGVGACMQSAEEWMGNCVNDDCPHQGSPEQFCFGFANCSCNNLTCTNGETCFPDSICWDGPSSAGSCINSCISEMNNLVNQCYSEYCTLE
jgi:hypothetical protein